MLKERQRGTRHCYVYKCPTFDLLGVKATCLSKRFFNIFGSIWKPYIRAKCQTNGPNTVYRQVIRQLHTWVLWRHSCPAHPLGECDSGMSRISSSISLNVHLNLRSTPTPTDACNLIVWPTYTNSNRSWPKKRKRTLKRVLLAVAQRWRHHIVHEASFCGDCYSSIPFPVPLHSGFVIRKDFLCSVRDHTLNGQHGSKAQ